MNDLSLPPLAEEVQGSDESPSAGEEQAEQTSGGLAAAPEKPGESIGCYRLLQKIGEGGWGVVYMAEQHKPMRRRVALKVVKPGMDSRQVLARFEAERQALALMDHPHIAKVLEAGATPAGRPFFVMELVRGIRITDYCDQHQLSTRERLELFMQVCQAIQHAHQKGIIHRDIKPSNILVTLHDGRPVPKVIDFGIAKATAGQELTDKTLFTAFEQFMGTPAYMSPEQAEMSGLDIDTRSDIYSLGVLLYELLVGKTPFEQKDLIKAGIDGMRRIIREKDPPRPSTRLSTLRPDEKTLIAKCRQAEPPRLVGLLRGDLDWIVMKCLDKDRTRRYDTANGVAEDVLRHLSSEPVQARPPSKVYRLRKMAARNKFAFAAGLLLATVLVAGLGLAMWALKAQRRVNAVQREANAFLAKKEADLQSSVQKLKRAEQLQIALRQKAESLAELAELSRVQDLAAQNQAATALAHLAAQVRRNPSNVMSSGLLLSKVLYRPWPRLVTGFGLGGVPQDRLAFSRDSTRMLCADGQVSVWDARSGEPALHAFGEAVESASFDPSGRYILTRASGGHVQVWSAANAHGVSPVFGEQVLSAEFNPVDERVLTISRSGVRLWNGQSGQPIAGPLGTEVDVAWFSPDGRRLFATSKVRAWAWDAGSGALINELELNQPPISGSVEGQVLVLAEGRAQVWSIGSKARISEFGQGLEEAEFSQDGRLVIALSGGAARVWEVRSGQPMSEPFGRNVREASLSPDGQHVLMVSMDGVQVWSVEGNELLPTALAVEPGTYVYKTGFSADGNSLYTVMRRGSEQTAIRVWDTHTGEPTTEPLDGAYAAFSPDGRQLVIADATSTSLWDLGELIVQPRQYRHAHATSTLLSADGRRMITLSQGGILWLWNVLTGQWVTQFSEVTSTGFSPDGRLLAIAKGRNVLVLTSETLRPATDSLPHPAIVVALAFSPEGHSLATTGADNSVRLWDLRHPGQCVEMPLSLRWGIRSLALDSQLFAMTDGLAVRVWDLTAKRMSVRTFRDEVMSVSLAPDHRLLINSRWGPIQIWDSRTDQLEELGAVASAKYSSNGRRVLVGRSDGSFQLCPGLTKEELGAAVDLGRDYQGAIFSPDDECAILATKLGRIVIRNAETGQAIYESLRFDAPQGLVRLSMTRDGRRLAAPSTSGAVVWELPEIAPAQAPLLANLAEYVAGKRMTNGVPASTSILERIQAKAALLNAAPANAQEPVQRVVRWRLMVKPQTASPFIPSAGGE